MLKRYFILEEEEVTTSASFVDDLGAEGFRQDVDHRSGRVFGYEESPEFGRHEAGGGGVGGRRPATAPTAGTTPAETTEEINHG